MDAEVPNQGMDQVEIAMDQLRLQEDPVAEDAMDQTKANDRPLVIVTAGKQGMGKSTLLNSLLDLDQNNQVQTGSTGNAVTKHVHKVTHRVRNTTVSIIDTPGLQDLDIDETEVLGELLHHTKGKADLLFYCISLLPGSKVDVKDIKIIQRLTRNFGEKIWDSTILVLTFANMHFLFDPNTNADELTKNYKMHFDKAMKKAGVKNKTGDNPNGIPVVLAGKKGEKLPMAKDGDMMWDEEIFVLALKKSDAMACPALLELKVPWKSWEIYLSTFAGGAIGTACSPIGTLPIVGCGVGGIIGSAFFAQRVYEVLKIKKVAAKLDKEEPRNVVVET